jgi:hypothetical protein
MTAYSKARQVGGLTTRSTAELRALVLDGQRERLVALAREVETVYRTHFREVETLCDGGLCTALTDAGHQLDAALGALDRAIAANEGTEHAEDAATQQGHRALPEEGERQAEGA